MLHGGEQPEASDCSALAAQTAALDAETERLMLESMLADDDEDEEDDGTQLQQLMELQQQQRQPGAGLRPPDRHKDEHGGDAGDDDTGDAVIGEEQLEAHDLTRRAEGAGAGAAWSEAYPEAFSAALAEAHAWSRIIRPPRKRGKHVVLDLCSAGQREGVTDHSRGVLLRQVLSRSERDGLLGPMGYRLARKARWGDLWPLSYQRVATRLAEPPERPGDPPSRPPPRGGRT